MLIDDLLRDTRERAHKAGQITLDLFNDFNGLPKEMDRTELYQHDQNWTNRMILGDSLQVMASLAEREGLRGQVQCIYLDPPYGIKFNSNFQWSTTSRDVKDGNAAHITREPEPSTHPASRWRWPVLASWARAIRSTCWPIPAKANSKKLKSPGAYRARIPPTATIRHGFVYERVPHITLKSIANNAEIDVIWDQWQQTLEPLREQLNAALNKNWQEWEIPREAGEDWPESAKKLHADWWQARIARQKEIDASIAAKAEFEYLYDKPYENKKCVRVTGPFTVDSLSPHRMLGMDENDELIDIQWESGTDYAAKQSFPQMILENLKMAGVQQAHKEDRITFTALTP